MTFPTVPKIIHDCPWIVCAIRGYPWAPTLRPFARFWNSAKSEGSGRFIMIPYCGELGSRDFILYNNIEPVASYFLEVWVINFGASRHLLVASGLSKDFSDFSRSARPAGRYIGRKIRCSPQSGHRRVEPWRCVNVRKRWLTF